jgi:hypothetical protein
MPSLTYARSLWAVATTGSPAALAISTLAAGRITTGAETLALLGAGDGTLKSVSLGLWVLTML